MLSCGGVQGASVSGEGVSAVSNTKGHHAHHLLKSYHMR